MKTVNGIYTSAHIYAETIEDYALTQIQMLCDAPASAGSVIRIMPDVHPGAIGPVGFTQIINSTVMPGLVGTDIGCGLTTVKLRQKHLEYQKLDAVIRDYIPVGFDIRRTEHPLADTFDFTRLHCGKHINRQKAALSLGSLGGGNHFIEVGRDDDGTLYLTVHSGSRHLGKETAEYYLNAGQKQLQEAGISAPYPLTYLTGSLMEAYLQDVAVITEYAALNRTAMISELAKRMKLKIMESQTCIHNYISTGSAADTGALRHIIRKGAISAEAGESLLIPVNMRDGIILAVGRGNPDWNCSAPHGAGRIMSRESVRNQFTVSRYKAEMKGIHSTCIGPGTLDEAPFAYRGIGEIIRAVEPTATVLNIIRPLYNYKAGHREKGVK